MEEIMKKSPLKKIITEQPKKEQPKLELNNPEEEQQMYDEEDLIDEAQNEPVAEVSSDAVEVQLELKIRKLADIEHQLITRKIAIKNPNSLTGVFSEQEMLSLATQLKFEIQQTIEYMTKNMGYKNEFFVEKFKEVEKGLKSYEYWIIDDKKK
jgi:hypothetical protein